MVFSFSVHRLLPRTLRGRFLWLALLVEVAMLCALIFNSLRLLNHSMEAQSRRYAEQMSPLLAAALVAPIAHRDYATISEILSQTERSDSLEYVVVFDRSGKVISSSGWPQNKPLPALGSDPPDHPSLGTSLIYHVSAPIVLNSQALGSMQYGVSLHHIALARQSLVEQGVMIAIAEILLSGFILATFGIILTRQLSQLTQAASRVAQGNWTAPPLQTGQGEIGTLSNAFNTMQHAVAERVQQLSQARDEATSLAQRISQEHARSVALLSAMNVGVLFLNTNRRPMYCNPSFLTLFGWEDQTLESVLTLERLQEDLQARSTHSAPALDLITPPPQTQEITLLSGRHLSVSRHPIQDEHSQSQGELWLFHDVTEQKRAASQLLEAKNEADADSRAKSEFLATVSHEIRTPMNAIMGMTHLTLETSLNANQRQYLELVQTSAKDLMFIINDILDFSKIEAGHLHIENTAFDLPQLLQRMLTPLAVTAQHRGLTLSWIINPNVPTTLAGDPLRIQQVLTNLVGNAIKFSHAGLVHVRVSTCPPETPATAQKIEFSVRDQGIGIEPSQLTRIFDPFTQADSSTTRHYGGSGLGLTISQRLVKTMGGEITVDSTLGKGSLFRFTLPLQVALPDPQAPDAPTPDMTRQPCALHVLLAEDNPVNALLVVSLLQKWGHRVTVAHNGQEAVVHHRNGAFDVVLMDMQMPVLDGLDATRKIRETEARTGLRTPIIAMTANAMEGTEQACREAGMDDYISKPIHHQILQRKLTKIAHFSPVVP